MAVEPSPRLGGASGFAGIPRGALTEITGAWGAGKTRAVLAILTENPRVRAAWIEDGLTAYPPAFAQAGIAEERVLFIDTADVVWAAAQALRSRLFELVVLAASPRLAVGEGSACGAGAKARSATGRSAVGIDGTALRRLQLDAEKAGAVVVFLRESPLESEVSWLFSRRARVEGGAVADRESATHAVG